jgi:hypothetical protein
VRLFETIWWRYGVFGDYWTGMVLGYFCETTASLFEYQLETTSRLFGYCKTNWRLFEDSKIEFKGGLQGIQGSMIRKGALGV